MKKNSRKIPATIATQHPDHAGKPFWHSESFIPTVAEAKESFLSFSKLGISEYKWDWEGKLVDESVLERLLAQYFDYFKKNPIGKEKFLTFRLPNPKVETEFRLSRALMGIASAAGLAKQVGLHSPPLFEVILPMTESAEEMVNIQEAFAEIASLKHPLNKFDKNLLSHILMIPLFEQVPTIINSDQILEKYLALHKQKFGFKPLYIRPYVARSDPALNSGIVPTILGIKIALSRYKKFEKKHDLPLFPMVGVGTLPFRGGLNPLHPQSFVQEYKGIRTATIQSAFRYDFPIAKVAAAVKVLERDLPRGQAKLIDANEEKKLLEIINKFETAYQSTIGGVAPLVNQVAKYFPKRRERVQHIGLFGYSRGVGKVKLPRAITYTGALYSLGVPPELIGTGRALAKLSPDDVKLMRKYYVNFAEDMTFAGGFLYKAGLMKLAKKNNSWKNILLDVENLEKYFGQRFKANKDQLAHQKLSAQILSKLSTKKNLTPFIEKSALLRKSMG